MLLKLARLHGEPEIFYTIQGEGRNMGRPSVFVRTSLCNLHCVWCDTDYTWNWIGTPFSHVNDADPSYCKFDKKDWLIRCTIAETAGRVAAFPCKNVVLTGGEPMMQQAALAALMDALRSIDATYRFEVETNATYVPIPDFDARVDQYNASPKLENSGNTRRLRERPAALRFFAASPKTGFKFVIAEPSDMEEVLQLISRYDIPPEKVWLMPEGNTRQALSARREWLVEVCKVYGFNYTDRLHVQIWETQKGV
ncbi:MAG: 7-carboxy-7-deazaguanine synthase QueE [Saprospiraceae bacterium]|nr:7-carboxy-7-deazaguanine synthase QueE [Saprospiraceae bacterium]